MSKSLFFGSVFFREAWAVWRRHFLHIAVIYAPMVAGAWFALHISYAPIVEHAVALAFIGLLCAGLGQLCGLSAFAYWVGPPLVFYATFVFTFFVDRPLGFLMCVLIVVGGIICCDFKKKRPV